MTVAVRFAPSPTGLLHVGNARVALVNWLFARKAGGRFVLRFDDTDVARSEARHAEAIEADLRWLGLTWDEAVWQSRRMDRYRAAFERLKDAGRVYPCYETEDELAEARKRRMARGRPPVYDRAALALTPAQRESLEREGRRPYWRFRLDDAPVAWDDLIHGALRVDPTSLSDPVVLRADGTPLYVFTSVVDDIDLGITHIIRGDDHIANSGTQIQLFRALAAAGEGPDRSPQLAHLPLLTDARGGSLSKRLGSLALERLRADGAEPMAVNSLLAKLGTSDPVEPRHGLDGLVAEFDLDKFGRAGAKFDLAELWRLNARLLHDTPFAEVRGRLEALGLKGVDAAFWEAVRPNLTRLEDAVEWWRVCRGPVEPVILDPELTSEAAQLLPAGALESASWETWTEAVAAATGRRGRRLFRPLRLALTGRERGPELKTLLPLIGRDRAAARLNGKTA